MSVLLPPMQHNASGSVMAWSNIGSSGGFAREDGLGAHFVLILHSEFRRISDVALKWCSDGIMCVFSLSTPARKFLNF